MINEKIGRGVETGPVTGNNSNLTLIAYDLTKKGSVVNFCLQLRIDTAFSPTYNTVLLYMPFVPENNLAFVTRLVGGPGDASEHSISTCYISKNKSLQVGFGPYTGFSVGNVITVYGTYIATT